MAMLGRMLDYQPNDQNEWCDQPALKESPLKLNGMATHLDHREDTDYYSQVARSFSS